MKKIEKLTGLIAAPHTIFDSDNRIDLEAIDRTADVIAAQKLSGVFISGSTGEGISCTVEERLAVMERWSRAARGRFKIIVHTGALALGDVETLAERANELGVWGTSVVPANYFKPATVRELVDFCRIAAAAAPDCAFYYYHSSLSGVNLPMVDFLLAAHGEIPNLAGIKFNSPDLYEFQQCRRLFDGYYDIVYGVDEFFAAALALGADGFIGSTYNYAASLYNDIRAAFDRHDMERVEADMAKVCAVVALLCRYGGIAAGKTLMNLRGIDGGDVRLPLRKLSRNEKKELLAQAGEILQ